MQDTQNIQDTQNVQPENKPYKKIILIIAVVLFLILTLVVVRAYVKSSSISKKSDVLRQTILNQIYIQKDEVSLKEQRAEDSDSALEIINQNKQYIQGQINDLKTNKETTYFVEEGSYICDDRSKISQEDFIFNRVFCPDGSFSFQGNDRNIEITTSHPLIIHKIFLASSTVSQQEYNYDVLEENKYELEVELNNFLNQDNEIENKLSEIKKNSGAVIAQVLDLLQYISKKSLILFDSDDGLSIILSSSYESKSDIDFKSEFENMENIEFPSEQEINSVELKSQCIEFFDEITKNSPEIQTSISEKLLLIKNSVDDICGNLEKYQKQNAIKMLRRMQTEQSPLIKFENSFYLQSFVHCNEEWFDDESNNCIKDLLNSW